MRARGRAHGAEEIRRGAQGADANKDEAFTALAADLRGDIMLAQGRLDEARAAYKLAAEKAGPRNPVKALATTKLNALGGAQ